MSEHGDTSDIYNEGYQWPEIEKHCGYCATYDEVNSIARYDYNRAKLCADACAGIDSVFLRAWAHAVQQNNGKPWDQRIDENLSEIQRLRQQNAELLADARRIDWLADPNNSIGNVQLPRDIVERNLGSLREAIDEAIAKEGNP